MFKSYDENPLPASTTDRIIKTGIFAYTRNPIYLAIVMFFFSMFLVFENVMYFFISCWTRYLVAQLCNKIRRNFFTK